MFWFGKEKRGDVGLGWLEVIAEAAECKILRFISVLSLDESVRYESPRP